MLLRPARTPTQALRTPLPLVALVLVTIGSRELRGQSAFPVDNVPPPATTPAEPASGSKELVSHPIDPALALMRRCKQRLAEVKDYSAMFVKEERIGKVMSAPQYIQCKFRIQPHSVYFKWVQPEAGKEAIYVEGQNDNKILTHSVGLARALAGTLKIDPEGPLARKGNRHTIREAGIANMVDRLLERWEFERRYQETEVQIQHVRINERPCILIETVHPYPNDGKFHFHTLKVYVDKQENLPIRMEAYDFPEQPGRTPGPMVECYTYVELRVNTGLTDMDFSTKNPAYHFSRF